MSSFNKEVIHLYRLPVLSDSNKDDLLASVRKSVSNALTVEFEYCYNIEIIATSSDATIPSSLPIDQYKKLIWLISETFEPELTSNISYLSTNSDSTETNTAGKVIFEVGPRLAFSTAWSSNCLSQCISCGITNVTRIERSRRYKVTVPESSLLVTDDVVHRMSEPLYDRMTECLYDHKITTFNTGNTAEKVKTIPVLSEGRTALERINVERGLGFDDFDLDFYTKMFKEQLGRDPTDVECFDLGQSNSEHSRHWFFSGKMVIDGIEQEGTLFSMVKATLQTSESNSIIAFHDNSSAIQGFPTYRLASSEPSKASLMEVKNVTLHPILTAETHNFPTGVAPFPGAETGTGGRLRDVQATGRGAHTLAGISSYCVGNLNIPEHVLPWENADDQYPSTLAKPLDILINASNGASDYGNKYGEPVICGFTRSFGQRLPLGERVEWIKPIMFTAGIGLLDSRHAVKGEPEVGMIVCKIGGPAYRIGMGGGAASSRVQQGNAIEASLDFNAVQRGDAEMENRMNRVIRACIEMGEHNPIISIHDQGAGGNGNVLKEIVDPQGAVYELRKIPVGDITLSALEIWGAEYQENNAFLVKPDSVALVMAMSQRENCPVSAIGVITGDGNVVVNDSTDGSTPFNLPLSLVLGKMPQKVFTFISPPKDANKEPLVLPEGETIMDAITRVMKLVDVGSKRFLTNKVDRSVTGLIAQQQCVGPLHIPLSNVGVVATSHFDTTGIAVAIGEQPIKGLLNNGAQARMTVGEAMTNMMWANITRRGDIKASCNWMWASKMEDEGSKMWEACKALTDALIAVNIGIDGGKDSLSMAAKVGNEIVKCPGQVTLTCYASCVDVTKTVTPDLKYPGTGVLLYVDLSHGSCRIGGTSLATVYSQVGSDCPDVDDFGLLADAFDVVQELVALGLIASGHDRSDGGLIVTALEMAFTGNCGIDINIPKTCSDTARVNSSDDGAFAHLFNEELGLILEVLPSNIEVVVGRLSSKSIPVIRVGQVTSDKNIKIHYDGRPVVAESVAALRSVWESTSFALEKRQCTLKCVMQEEEALAARTGPTYHVTYDMKSILPPSIASLINQVAPSSSSTSRVAVIRQEGSNGDREMLAAFHAAGLEAWDINMNDLSSGAITLDRFKGIVFCGGFSYADVNDSAKGWAGVIKFNDRLLDQFTHFRKVRRDTFTLGICNGCQLMALLGYVPFDTIDQEHEQPRFIHNESGRFESRWSAVTIKKSNAILFQGMEGSTLGVWVSHGEGKAYFPNKQHMDAVLADDLAPLRYVDDNNQVTSMYPMNPNGSPQGIAALCTADGRHLAMMPHPERCFLSWQWPYMPSSMKQQLDRDIPSGHLLVSPWFKMFQNAKIFCDSSSK